MPNDQRRPFSLRKPHRLPEVRYSELGTAFLITIRTKWGKRPFEDTTRANMVIDVLADQREKVGCWVGAYCVMPDHVHFVCGPNDDEASVKRLVDRFKGASTNASWAADWSGPLWQQKFHDSQLEDEASLLATIEYVLNNPVRAGLVAVPDEWPWSGVMDEIP